MIEESINNLTDEIRELKEILAQLVSAYVKYELTDWKDVDVDTVSSEQTEVATKEDSPKPVTVKNSPEPVTVKEMSDAQALAIVSGDEVVEEIELPSIEEMYMATIKHVSSFPELKGVVKEWVTERNATSLRKVDESYQQECYDFLTALGVSL